MNKKKLKNSIWALPVYTAAVWMMSGTVAWAAAEIVIDVNQSQVMNVNGGISRIAIANPAIADVTVTSGQQLLIVAKGVGSTSLYVWDGGGSRHDYTVVITDQDVGTGEVIQHSIGYPGVRVDKIGGKILLTGEVKDQEQQQRAAAIAKMYGSDVVDMLTLTDPMQIRIEARIVEISKNKTKNLGINWGNASSVDSTTGIASVNPGSFSFGQYSKFDTTTMSYDSSGNPTSINSRSYNSAAPLMATLNLLIGNGDAKVLSQPHVVTMSGQKASILIGGEMPVPSTNSNGSTNVQWKNYGIELNMEPVANEDGLITSKVMVSVSTLSSAAGIIVNGTSLMGLATRKAETVISLPSGQTMVIGGLISTEDTKSINKIPILGDIPILGRLFRDVSESHDEKELLIFITPTMVDNSTSTKVSEAMQHELHTITRDEQQMPVIPKIMDSHTVVAKDEYQEEDESLAAQRAERKLKEKQEIAKARAKRLAKAAAEETKSPGGGIHAASEADRITSMHTMSRTTDLYQQTVAANNANNSIVPVRLDQHMNDTNNTSHSEYTPGILEQKLAILRAKNDKT
ncbi:MAG: pilus assembly protein N-terminal domain-containing protein [Megasphaera sp.]|jgi:pilus assembly protein CpaC|nr:pilus assembly protein N-terminal domain-containing protein [Megasphaera sp.]